MISVRVLPRFPARVETGAGLDVEREAGVYTFSLDFESLNSATVIANADTTFVPVWDSDQDAYTRLSANAFGAVLSAGFVGVSTSSVAVGTGAKSFTASTGRAWAATQRVRIATDDNASVMSGPVTSYDSTTGALVVEVDYTLGSGTYADWNITVGGERGATGQDGEGVGDFVGPSGATGNNFVIYDGGTGKLAKDLGLSLSVDGTFAANSDALIPSEKAVRTALLSSTFTLTNKRVTPRIGTTASSSTPTPNADTHDQYNVTAQAATATFGAPTGTPTDGQKLIVRVKDNGTARTLNWNAIYREGDDVSLPTTTVLSKTLYCGFIYNAADTKWDLVAVVNNI